MAIAAFVLSVIALVVAIVSVRWTRVQGMAARQHTALEHKREEDSNSARPHLSTYMDAYASVKDVVLVAPRIRIENRGADLAYSVTVRLHHGSAHLHGIWKSADYVWELDNPLRPGDSEERSLKDVGAQVGTFIVSWTDGRGTQTEDLELVLATE